jgi:diketogulonate reductase-like aldo/keto reductase
MVPQDTDTLILQRSIETRRTSARPSTGQSDTGAPCFFTLFAGITRFLTETGLPRSDLFVTTKFFPQGKAGEAVRTALQNSLVRLGLDYVDLYLIHAPRNRAVRKQQWEMFETLRDEGLTKSIGVSNYGIHHLKELLGHARIKPVVNQVCSCAISLITRSSNLVLIAG